MSIRRHFELALAVLLACGFVGVASADEDGLTPYRDRFRQGMERYKSGAMAEAIRVWSAIYEEIGAERGYRLSFNLARAYEANSETSRAAERYQSFLDEVARRRAAGETLDPIVEHEEQEAETRLKDLDASNGRIRILAAGKSIITRIDSADPRLGLFISYVAPGDHVVVFSPGSKEEERREVTVKAGEIVDVAPSARPEIFFPPLDEVRPSIVEKPVTQLRRLQVEHPFSPIVLYVAVGTTALSVLVPIVTYAHAYSLINTHNATTTSTSQRRSIESEYPGVRTAAYATLAVPITLAAATVGLAGYYFAGSKEREVQVIATPLPGGAAAGVSGSF
jgi:hypothetical protein